MTGVSLHQLAAYFLGLGTWGFGGPVALTGAMHRDLVTRRGWISEQDFEEGVALAQLAPGPLAAQLAMYLGYIVGRTPGALVIAVAFIAPSFLMVWALSIAYVRFGGFVWLQPVLTGVSAAIIGLLAKSAWSLARSSARRDPLRWLLVALLAVVTAWLERELVWLILAGGVCCVARLSLRGTTLFSLAPLALALPPVAPMAIAGPATLTQILWYFAKAGAVVFGSGLAIVPFLYGGTVQQFGWLDDRQFLDAVAVAMVTPGPVVITVGFIGYLVDGTAGLFAAALGVFLPVFLFVVIPAPYFRRFGTRPVVREFVSGVTAAATGAIAGAAWVLGSRALIDAWALGLAALSLALLSVRRVPDATVVLVGGLCGWWIWTP